MAFLRPARPFFVVLLTVAAHACPVCNSRTGHLVRAGLLNGHFLHTLLLVLAPFPVFAAAVFLLHLGMPDLHLPASLTGSNVLPEPELTA